MADKRRIVLEIAAHKETCGKCDLWWSEPVPQGMRRRCQAFDVPLETNDRGRHWRRAAECLAAEQQAGVVSRKRRPHG